MESARRWQRKEEEEKEGGMEGDCTTGLVCSESMDESLRAKDVSHASQLCRLGGITLDAHSAIHLLSV
jgi:hypothetical protein